MLHEVIEGRHEHRRTHVVRCSIRSQRLLQLLGAHGVREQEGGLDQNGALGNGGSAGCESLSIDFDLIRAFAEEDAAVASEIQVRLASARPRGRGAIEAPNAGH